MKEPKWTLDFGLELLRDVEPILAEAGWRRVPR